MCKAKPSGCIFNTFYAARSSLCIYFILQSLRQRRNEVSVVLRKVLLILILLNFIVTYGIFLLLCVMVHMGWDIAF